MTLTSRLAIALLALGGASAQATSQHLSFGSSTVTSSKVDHAAFVETLNFHFEGSSGMMSASAYQWSQHIDVTWPAIKLGTFEGQWFGHGSTLTGANWSYGLTATAQPVPEPGSGILLLTGMTFLAMPTLLRKRHERRFQKCDAR